MTVKRANEARVCDIMLPANMPVGELAAILARKLGWEHDADNQPVRYEVVADPPGRLLHQDETLAEAGTWDGSWLVFYLLGTAPRSTPGDLVDSIEQPARRSPVLKWLGISKPAALPSETPQSASGIPPQSDLGDWADSVEQSEHGSPLVGWSSINKPASLPTEATQAAPEDGTKAEGRDDPPVPPNDTSAPKYIFRRIDEDM